jgi:hypothetical protein
MRQELDDLLCQRYPDIFRDRHGNQEETGMCWGFCCGEGWFDIINDLCAEITARVAAGEMPPVVASQVKSKTGFLRFYFKGQFEPNANPQAHALIRAAQLRSEFTCEECGGFGLECPGHPPVRS